MSSYPPPDNEPPNYASPAQPYGYPPSYPQPDQPYGAPPNYGQPDQAYGPSTGYPPANPYGTPPGYDQPYGYGAQPNYDQQAQPYAMPYPMAAPASNGLATASLILGILAIFAWILTGIPAVITGHMALARIKANPMLPGRGMAIAGLILGYISIALAACLIGAIAVAIAHGGGSVNSTS